MPGLATELISLKVDIIVSFGTVTTIALQKATSTIPIVMASTFDPVGNGLVKSLARPGGNITGLSSLVARSVASILKCCLAWRRNFPVWLFC